MQTIDIIEGSIDRIGDFPNKYWYWRKYARLKSISAVDFCVCTTYKSQTPIVWRQVHSIHWISNVYEKVLNNNINWLIYSHVCWLVWNENLEKYDEWKNVTMKLYVTLHSLALPNFIILNVWLQWNELLQRYFGQIPVQWKLIHACYKSILMRKIYRVAAKINSTLYCSKPKFKNELPKVYCK